MSIQEEFSEFIEDSFNAAWENYRQTKEYELMREKREQMDVRFEALGEYRTVLEECAFQIGADADRRLEFVYRSGLKDCIFILKELGVLV